MSEEKKNPSSPAGQGGERTEWFNTYMVGMSLWKTNDKYMLAPACSKMKEAIHKLEAQLSDTTKRGERTAILIDLQEVYGSYVAACATTKISAIKEQARLDAINEELGAKKAVPQKK